MSQLVYTSFYLLSLSFFNHNIAEDENNSIKLFGLPLTDLDSTVHNEMLLPTALLKLVGWLEAHPIGIQG